MDRKRPFWIIGGFALILLGAIETWRAGLLELISLRPAAVLLFLPSVSLGAAMVLCGSLVKPGARGRILACGGAAAVIMFMLGVLALLREFAWVAVGAGINLMGIFVFVVLLATVELVVQSVVAGCALSIRAKPEHSTPIRTFAVIVGGAHALQLIVLAIALGARALEPGPTILGLGIVAAEIFLVFTLRAESQARRSVALLIALAALTSVFLLPEFMAWVKAGGRMDPQKAFAAFLGALTFVWAPMAVTAAGTAEALSTTRVLSLRRRRGPILLPKRPPAAGLRK